VKGESLHKTGNRGEHESGLNEIQFLPDEQIVGRRCHAHVDLFDADVSSCRLPHSHTHMVEKKSCSTPVESSGDARPRERRGLASPTELRER